MDETEVEIFQCSRCLFVKIEVNNWMRSDQETMEQNLHTFLQFLKLFALSYYSLRSINRSRF